MYAFPLSLKLKHDLPSSLNVKRPICGKSLKASKQTLPAGTSSRTIALWSCFTNLGLCADFSPFLSIRQINAYNAKGDDLYKNKKHPKVKTNSVIFRTH